MQRALILLGLCISCASCSGSPTTTKAFTPKQAEDLSRGWVQAAIADQDYALKARCEDQGEPSELLGFELDRIASVAVTPESVEGSPQDTYYLVRFHDSVSERSDTVSPLAEIVFVSTDVYERMWDAELAEGYPYSWCAYVNQ